MEPIVLGGLFLWLIHWLLSPIYKWIYRGKRKAFPPLEDPILKLSAVKLAEKIRIKEISSEQVTIAYIKRIKDVNFYLNAVVEDRFVEAVNDARKIDYLLREIEVNKEEIAITKPLLGVPITIKESCKLKDLSYTGGSLTRKGIKAFEDSKTVDTLKKAGAIPLLVSNTPEYCLGWDSVNMITGSTRNPYDTNRVSGGSSGGEGALLGAGASVIGLGSDVAGSVRLPAQFNGVFGHKPTRRTVPLDGHFPTSTDDKVEDFLTMGPMVRYAEDLKLMMSVIQKDDANLQLDHKVDLRGLNIFCVEEIKRVFIDPVQQEIKDKLSGAALYLEQNYDCKIIKNDINLDDIIETCVSEFFNLKDIPYALLHSKEDKEDNLWLELVKSIVGQSKYTFQLLVFYAIARLNGFIRKANKQLYKEKNEELRSYLQRKLGDHGVLFLPTFPTSAFYPYQAPQQIISTAYLMLGNITGFPSLHLPLGFDKEGLPIGIQVIAAPYQDRICFAVAEALEKGFGGWKAP